MSSGLPIHFFTIVLNGEPFIRHHLPVFERLDFPWHWHIIEGVAALKHDTAWSLSTGGRVPGQLHREGRSVDGTFEYLDQIAGLSPARITVYRKTPGEFWDGKLEMVNAPLATIRTPCLLWQVDSDELWTAKQICDARELFNRHPDAMAAFYLCRYFVGERLVITSRNTYGNHLDYEWLRTWRFQPGMRWTSHEPPRLCRPIAPNEWQDLATINPLRHAITEPAGLIFQHFAYTIEAQLQFKESYYGYPKAVAQWRKLQAVSQFPVFLRDYFGWVSDGAEVNTVSSQDIAPIAQKNVLGQWRFQSAPAADGAPLRIVWARLDSIGDNVLAASMLPHIRQKFPHAELTVFCQQRVVELYEASPHVDAVIGIDLEKARGDKNGKKYAASFKEHWKRYRPDLALNSVYSRDPFADQLIADTGAAMRIGFIGDLSNTTRELSEKTHAFYHRLLESNPASVTELERHADFLRGLGIDATSLQPLAWTTDADEQFAESFCRRNKLAPQSTLALFIGAQWDLKLYDGFLDALRPFANYTLLLLGGPREQSRAQEFLKRHPGVTHNLTGETTLRQMTALLRRCRLLVSTDSAGAHLAAAVGTPQVVVLGGGHFGRFLPYSPLTSIVCLPIDCYHCNWECIHPRVHCIQNITPDLLARAIAESLKHPASVPRVFVQSYTGAGYRPDEPCGVDLASVFDASRVEIIRELTAPAPANWPSISVLSIVAAEDLEAQALAAIESVRQQGYPYHEHLVATCVSSRKTPPFLLPNVRMVSLPGQSSSQAANHLLGQAKGEIIGWLEPGETYEPGAFRAVATFFQKHSTRGVLAGRSQLKPEAQQVPARDSALLAGSEIPRVGANRFLPQTSALFFRRKLLEKLGPLDESLQTMAWLDLSLRLAKQNRFWPLAAILVNRPARTSTQEIEEASRSGDGERRQLYRRHWAAIVRHGLRSIHQPAPARNARK